VSNNNLLIDLFCGGGGFSLGAHYAGFETALAVDVNATLSSSIPLNFPRAKLVNTDLAEADIAKHPDVAGKPITGIIGGPPCQGFSMIGKREASDPRNLLVGHFFRNVAAVKPIFFVMENVPGILEEDNRKSLDLAMEVVGGLYKIVGPLTIDASEYGAATSRTRVVIIGFREEYCDAFDETDFEVFKTKRKPTVHDAIADLPGPAAAELLKDEFEWACYPQEGGERVSRYAKAARALPKYNLGWKVAIEQLKQGRLSGNQVTVHSPEIAKRYAAVTGGKRDSVSKSYKLEWTSQCPTLRAGTGPDRGSFNAVRPLHPDEGRVITVREAARLQGFPDWFVFHPTKWHSFRMIGNSVSPYVSRAILKLIASKSGAQKIEMPDAA